MKHSLRQPSSSSSPTHPFMHFALQAFAVTGAVALAVAVAAVLAVAAPTTPASNRRVRAVPTGVPTGACSGASAASASSGARGVNVTGPVAPLSVADVAVVFVGARVLSQYAAPAVAVPPRRNSPASNSTIVAALLPDRSGAFGCPPTTGSFVDPPTAAGAIPGGGPGMGWVGGGFTMTCGLCGIGVIA